MAINFKLPTTDGTDGELRTFRGRVTLVVYETHDADGVNDSAKDALGRKVNENPDMAMRVSLIAIGNLSAVNIPIIRETVALPKVKAAAQTLGQPIWMDWSGVLEKNLGWSGKSVFALVDKRGDLRYQWMGRMTSDDIATMLTKIQELDRE